VQPFFEPSPIDDVILLVWVPYRAGIFQGRSYEGHIRFFFDSDADAANLQQDHDKLAEWESKWLMKFHPEKCNVLTIYKKRSPSKTDGVVGFRADGAYMFTPFEV
jgi:hypothetical protein